MRFKFPFALMSAALACALSAIPAQAQRARVFVASYGSDTNPCTFGSPCKTFQAAVNAVAAGGEVTAIDSAGFQPVNITKSVTITSPAGVEAGIAAASGGNAITIGAGAGTVVLRGLTLDGAGSANFGIHATAGTDIEIYDCAVRNFAVDGISISSAAAMSVVISNTIATDSNNMGEGNGINLVTNGGPMIATLDQVIVDNNEGGIEVLGGSGAMEVSLSNSHIDNNARAMEISGSSAILQNVTLNQSFHGIALEGNATVWLSQVTQTAAPGFNNIDGLSFSGTGNTAFGDNTNHFDGGLGEGASVGMWASQ